MKWEGQQKLVVSDTGHHRVLVVSMQGVIEVKNQKKLSNFLEFFIF